MCVCVAWPPARTTNMEGYVLSCRLSQLLKWACALHTCEVRVACTVAHEPSGRLIRTHGSWLMAHGSWLMAHEPPPPQGHPLRCWLTAVPANAFVWGFRCQWLCRDVGVGVPVWQRSGVHVRASWVARMGSFLGRRTLVLGGSRLIMRRRELCWCGKQGCNAGRGALCWGGT